MLLLPPTSAGPAPGVRQLCPTTTPHPSPPSACRWLAIVAGEEHAYTGEAVNPKHLSLVSPQDRLVALRAQPERAQGVLSAGPPPGAARSPSPP